MQLESQVCSLELSKRLKELGVKQESLWWWVKHKNPPKEYPSLNKWSLCGYESAKDIYEQYHAYTVAELGEMLPEWCFTYKASKYHFQCGKYQPEQGEMEFYGAYSGKTEANTRAKMLIHLLENKLIKI